MQSNLLFIIFLFKEIHIPSTHHNETITGTYIPSYAN